MTVRSRGRIVLIGMPFGLDRREKRPFKRDALAGETFTVKGRAGSFCNSLKREHYLESAQVKAGKESINRTGERKEERSCYRPTDKLPVRSGQKNGGAVFFSEKAKNDQKKPICAGILEGGRKTETGVSKMSGMKGKTEWGRLRELWLGGEEGKERGESPGTSCL